VLDGGDGVDTARYTRNVRLTITLDGIANDGANGENDNVLDVENVTGGTYHDIIVGSVLANLLIGRAGNDDVTAGDGPDDLRGGAGTDVLRGGQGADTIDSVDGEVDQVQCGADIDTVTADTIDNVANTCENVTLV
jgi:serralysin